MRRRSIYRAGLCCLAALALATGWAVTRPTGDGLVLRVDRVDPTFGTIAVDEQANRVYLADTSRGAVIILDATTGAILRSVTLGDDPNSPNRLSPQAFSIDAQGGRVFVMCQSSQTVAVLDATTGRVLGTIPMGGEVLSIAPAAQSRRVAVFTTVYQASRLSILDAATGARLHSVYFDLQPGFSASYDSWPEMVAIDRQIDHVFVPGAAVTARNSIHIFDLRSGALLHTTLLSQAINDQAADERTGRLFLLTKTGLNIVDARTGALLITRTIGWNNGAIAVDSQSGHVFIGGGGAANAYTIQELDGRTGAVLRVIPVPVAPMWLALDHRPNHLVAVVGGMSRTVGKAPGDPRWPLALVDIATGRVTRLLDVAASDGLPHGVIDERSGRAFIISQSAVAAHAAWPPRWLQDWLPFLRPGRGTGQAMEGRVTVLDLSR